MGSYMACYCDSREYIAELGVVYFDRRGYIVDSGVVYFGNYSG